MKGYQKTATISLTSIGGIGPVFAAGIIAEIGDIRCFKSDNAVAQYSGITWSQNDSASFISQETRLTKTGNKYLRYYLIEAANSVRRNEPEYRDYYNSKFKEVTKHNHPRAVVLTSRKLIRLIYCLLVNNSLYDPNYLNK
jgi:transposase